MHKYDLTDTIAAISTPPGESGIGIVRISGKDALSIADKIFVSKDAKRPSAFKTYTTHYGWITANRTPDTNDPRPNNVIDEVILTVMRSPKSYTKEDVVEINCHGGAIALRRVLDLVLEQGCRLAEPGEFTKRAFLNGRIDLVQAEAVLDIIQAKCVSALEAGIRQLRGDLSKEIKKSRDGLLEILSILEANIDFPEEEIASADMSEISRRLKKIDNVFKAILENSDYGRILRDGINVVICGRTNVGKSSLLNALLKQERSIVTSIAGTTRDTIEEFINIKGIPVKIVDTAGIIKPRNFVEKKAIQRSKKYMESADLIILLFDGSRRLTREDMVFIRRLSKRNTLAVINKIDLKEKIKRGIITDKFGSVIDISAKKNININLLEDAVADFVYNGKVSAQESIIVTNLRHIEKIKAAHRHITNALNSLDNKLSIEFVAQDIRDALLYMDEILGKSFTEDMLQRIFSEFCIGK